MPTTHKSSFRQYLFVLLTKAKALKEAGIVQGLCYISYDLSWFNFEDAENYKKVTQMIYTLKKWNLNAGHSYYWPLNPIGMEIRIAILQVWCRFGGMKDKRKFVKHLKKELQKVNIPFSLLTNYNKLFMGATYE